MGSEDDGHLIVSQEPSPKAKEMLPSVSHTPVNERRPALPSTANPDLHEYVIDSVNSKDVLLASAFSRVGTLHEIGSHLSVTDVKVESA
mmetsp:Transcript_93039/g.194440  ORF Transcript_93039/g.194440 Transcript_93039/m.194440 type:complete len:89 (+) Transcript_93039:1836-2102(+)